MTNTNQTATTVASELQEQLNQTQRKFEIEKNAKNQAYCFIILLDLMKAFQEFCQNVTAENWHEACISALEIKAEEGGAQ
ncbi:MAG: hypothetical protein HDQ88_05385 [Clostridia bacterium]|nr:hypothetical protein [Clostridia bacterium]